MRRLGIDYDEIAFGKPVADVFIDGTTGIAHEDTEKEVRVLHVAHVVDRYTSAFVGLPLVILGCGMLTGVLR